ncbi:MAG: putative MPP superfamily phosphohydrolase [Crocinitomicaceae bacterium]|jgi:predicted MPP superfamily phosphohydrolase
MRSVIILIFALTSLAYNLWSYTSSIISPTTQLIVLIGFLVAAFICVFTLARMGIVFKSGYGQSDLLTNWSMGFFFGILLSSLLMMILFILEDMSRIGVGTTLKINTGFFMRPDKSALIRTMAMCLGSLPIVLLFVGMALGKYHYKVNKITLPYSDLPKAFDGFKLVQFSDLHSGNYDSSKAMIRASKLIQNQNADLIIFSGDWINAKPDEIKPYKDIFKSLHAEYGKYSCLGNHDYGANKAWMDLENHTHIVEELKIHVRDMGFISLNNASAKIEKDGESIQLLGVENWGNRPFPRKGDLDVATENVDKHDFSILLSHDPTHWNDRVIAHEHHFHLTLAGHTHGAQFGIETRWFRWSPVQYVYKRWGGLYEETGQFLYVNRGLGFIGYAGRVGIRPEITVFELRVK